MFPRTQRLPPTNVFPNIYVFPPIPTPPNTTNVPVLFDPDCSGFIITTLPYCVVLVKTTKLLPIFTLPPIPTPLYTTNAPVDGEMEGYLPVTIMFP